MKSVKIIKSGFPQVTVTAGVCDTFFTKFSGLMFRKKIHPYYGLLFSETTESRLNTSIHMFFMNFDITVLWLNRDYSIVDIALAKKWHPVYISKAPAQYTLELHVDRFSDYSIGDQLQVEINA
jgi:hypothetical protein